MTYLDKEDLEEKIKKIRKKVEDIDDVDDFRMIDSGYGWISCQISFKAEKEEVE